MSTNIDREPLLHREGAGSTSSSRRRAGGPPPRLAFFQNNNNNQSKQSPRGLDGSVITVDDSSFHFLGDVVGMGPDEQYHVTASQEHLQQRHQQQPSSSSPPPPPTYVVGETEKDLQRVVLRILGRAYLRNGSFWWPTLPISILLGAILALCTLMFLGSVHYCLLNLWFHPHIHIHDVHHHPTWIWPIYTTLGGLVTGGMFYLSGIPVGAVRTFFHDMVDLQGRPFETPLVVATCWVGLCLGCPLGPEMALGAMASGLATVLSQSLLMQGRMQHHRPPQQQPYNGEDDDNDLDDYDVTSRRVRASWVQMALAGSIGGVFPTPILAVLLVHELAVTGRPMAVPWDGLIRSQSTFPHQQLQRPSQAKPIDHDFMEQVTLMGACALTAGVVVRGIIRRILHKDLEMIYPLNTSSSTPQYSDWHLLAAIPLGLMCGLVTSLGLVVTSIARTIRTRVSQRYYQRQLQQQQQEQQHQQHEPQQHNGDVPSLIFPTLAGLFNGLAAVWLTPYVLGSGVDVMRDLLDQAIHPHNATNTNTFYSSLLANEETGNSGLLSPQSYLLVGLTKLVAFSVSLGFGMVGGPVVPSLFVGLCLGLAVTSGFSTGSWPLSLTVPCCMAATAGSMVPSPFALIGTVSILFALQPTQIGPVLVATMVAFGVTGGLGILRHVAEQRLGDPTTTAAVDDQPQHDDDLDDHLPNEHEHSEVYVSPLPSDEEILKGIRSAIFGTS